MSSSVTPKDWKWLTWWDGKLQSLALDLLVVAAVFWVYGHPDARPWQMPLIFADILTLTVRRRFPWLPVVLCVPFVAPVAAIACYTGSRTWGHRDWRTWGGAGYLVLSFLVWNAHQFARDGLWYSFGFPLLAVGTPLLLGLWMYQRQVLIETVQDRARQAERERDLLTERAVTAERHRIAREMHDVVAHRVSTISVQSGALSVTAPDDRTREAAETIRSTSTVALTELRDVLRVLRNDAQEKPDRTDETSPDNASLEGVRKLVAGAADTGAHVRLRVDAPLPTVPGSVSRAAYRVIQEALTNAAKHAPYAAVEVALGTENGSLWVTVDNRRGPTRGSAGVPGSGYGLLGMRERVSLAGGDLQTGPTRKGGYRVRARLPLEGEKETL